MKPVLAAFALIFTPLLVGGLFAISIFKENLIHTQPQPLEFQSQGIPKPPVLDPHRKKILLFLGDAGTEPLEFLSSYEILASIPEYQVLTVSRERRLLPLTGSLGILPDFDLSSAPEGQIWVFPGMIDEGLQIYATWMQQQIKTGKGPEFLVTFSEGGAIPALAGFLNEGEIATHTLSLKQLNKNFKNISWTDSKRWTKSKTNPPSYTSFGVANAIDFWSFYLRHAHLPFSIAAYLPRAIERAQDSHPISKMDLAQLFLRAGFDWWRQNIGLLVYNGVSELSLASVLDVFPRTMSARVVSIGEKRIFFSTAHGLKIVPNVDLLWAPKLDFLIVPSGITRLPASPTQEPALASWIRDRELLVRDATGFASDTSMEFSLEVLAKVEGHSIRSVVSRMLDYPSSQADKGSWDGFVWELILRALAVGVFGFLVTTFWMRWKSSVN